MKKKKIIYSIIAILVLVICFIIGQTVVKPTRENTTDAENEMNQGQEYYYDYILKSEELVYEGDVETTDMPGGKTVGLVEDDAYGKWYFLSPNTSITAGVILDEKERILKFEYFIHENVSRLSDGMQLEVVIVQEGTNSVLYENSLTVDGTSKECIVELTEWKNENVFIKMQAINSTGDETGDWLVIKNARID